MPEMPIPNDWDGVTWTCVFVDWPDSELWLSILRGFVTSPLRGRFWDGSTGNIKSVQNIGKEINERNDIMSCQDIVAQLAAINLTLQNLDVSNTAIATQTTNLVSTNVAAAIAVSNSFAWSQSFAQNILSVTVINNVELEMRFIQPTVDPPPTPEEEPTTGISATAQPTGDADVCARAYWILETTRVMINWLNDNKDWISYTVLAAAGAITSALEKASNLLTGGTKLFLIPSSVILQVSHLMSDLAQAGTLDTELQLLVDWLDDNFEVLQCLIFNTVVANANTKIIWDSIVADGVGFGVSNSAIGISRLGFNYSSLASLYFVSPLMDAFPASPPPLGPNCGDCGV